ncbi:MAG: homoserine kinase [Saprospiraceae bacterium]|nr:homoserine kinase [Saprospiraceae bacterium]
MSTPGIKVFAPASVSNLGCGFDILGLALERPGDEIIARMTDRKELRITEITGDKGQLPRNIHENTVTIAAAALLKHLGEEGRGIDFEIHKRMPFASGLGSSAASAVAGVVAMNELLRRPLEKRDLLPFAMQGEQHASQAWHADNVAPSLLGGIILVRDNASLDIHRIPAPRGLYLAILHPHILIQTADSRKRLPKNVALSDLVTQTGNLGGLIQGLYQSDFKLISRCLQDVVIEPHRSKDIPYYTEIREAALGTGALGCLISGSGPSMFALCDNSLLAEACGIAMKSVLKKHQLRCDLYISGIHAEGAMKY